MVVLDDYYSVLGVSSDASQREIRTAYLTLANAYHPDRNRSQANASIYAVNAASMLISYAIVSISVSAHL